MIKPTPLYYREQDNSGPTKELPDDMSYSDLCDDSDTDTCDVCGDEYHIDFIHDGTCEDCLDEINDPDDE